MILEEFLMERFPSAPHHCLYLSWIEFDPQLVLWPPQFCGELSMGLVPPLDDVIGDCVYDRAVIVVIAVDKGGLDTTNHAEAQNNMRKNRIKRWIHQ